jgi:hypothetical protein
MVSQLIIQDLTWGSEHARVEVSEFSKIVWLRLLFNPEDEGDMFL